MKRVHRLVACVSLGVWLRVDCRRDRGRPTCDYCRMIITEKEYGGNQDGKGQDSDLRCH
jgi:hypothetical protein